MLTAVEGLLELLGEEFFVPGDLVEVGHEGLVAELLGLLDDQLVEGAPHELVLSLYRVLTRLPNLLFHPQVCFRRRVPTYWEYRERRVMWSSYLHRFRTENKIIRILLFKG